MEPKQKSFAKVKSLAAVEGSCLEIVKQQRHISLPWFCMKNLKEGVKVIVENGLKRYIRK